MYKVPSDGQTSSNIGDVNFPGSSCDAKIKQDSKRVDKIIKSTVPMKSFGSPDEIIDADLFLCSGRVSFLKDIILALDSGQTVGIF